MIKILLIILFLAISANAQGVNVKIPNGDDVNNGRTSDAAVTTDITATMAAKARGIVKMLADTWDDPNNRFNVGAAQVGTWNIGTVTTLTGITNAVTVSQGTAANLNVRTETSADHSAVAPTRTENLGAYAEADGAALDSTGIIEGDLTRLKADVEGRLLVKTDHPRRVLCTISSTATTSTLITGCSAPGAGLSIWITDISFYSSVVSTVAAPNTIQSGTGGTCGAGTIVLWRGFNPQVFSGNEAHFTTPIKAGTNHEICFLNTIAGTRVVTVTGFIAP